MLGDKVTGLIDFYFAATDFFAYDLAVTHAAWSFDNHGRQFRDEVSTALLPGYESIRPPAAYERAAPPVRARGACRRFIRSEEHTSELKSQMRTSNAVLSLKKKKHTPVCK